MADLGTTPAAPAAGQTGHFAHHTWLVDAVTAINTQLEGVVSQEATQIDVSDVTTVAKVATALVSLVTALEAAGLITKVE